MRERERERERNAASNEPDEEDLDSLMELMFKTQLAGGTDIKEPAEHLQDDTGDSGEEPFIPDGEFVWRTDSTTPPIASVYTTIM